MLEHVQKTKEAGKAMGGDAERREKIYIVPGIFIYLWLKFKSLTSLEQIRSSFPNLVSMVIWLTNNHWIISSTTYETLILNS
jgi:hypothetical protein